VLVIEAMVWREGAELGFIFFGLTKM
jgi:hypothetical protein